MEPVKLNEANKEPQPLSEPVRLASEDVVILKAHRPVMYQQCCGCKLTHRIEVSPRDTDLRFRFVNVGYEFPDDFTIENYVETNAVG